MVDVNLLRRKIADRKMSLEELSKSLDIDPSTLYRRLKKNGNTFTISEANIIKRELKLSNKEAISIFFKE